MLNFAASAPPAAAPARAHVAAVRRGEARSAHAAKKRAADGASVVTSAAFENHGTQNARAAAAPHAAGAPSRRRAQSTRAAATSKVRVTRFHVRAAPRSASDGARLWYRKRSPKW